MISKPMSQSMYFDLQIIIPYDFIGSVNLY